MDSSISCGPVIIIIIIIIIINNLPLLCKVFTIIYLKQTIFLGYVVLPLFSGYDIWYMRCYIPCWMFCISTLVCSEVCVHCPVWMFSVLPWFCTFLVCCLGIFWMILIWFVALLLMMSLLFLYPTCAAFWLWDLYILKFPWHVAWSHCVVVVIIVFAVAAVIVIVCPVVDTNESNNISSTLNTPMFTIFACLMDVKLH